MPLISGREALQTFRDTWTGARILELLHQSRGRLCVDWALGVGKSANIDQVIEAALDGYQYDLVIALFPTRQLINERPWIRSPPTTYRIVNFRPRPRRRCGVSPLPLRNAPRPLVLTLEMSGRR